MFFPDYRGFPVPADENEHRIWIPQVKIHKLLEKIPSLLDDEVKYQICFSDAQPLKQITDS